MFSLSKKQIVQLAAGILPAVMSLIFLITMSWVWLVLCALLLFLIVGILPLFRKRESLYMFIFTAVAGLPVNIAFSYYIVSEGFLGAGFLIGDILWGALLCCIFFSVEEIIFGVVTRLVWKRQYKLKLGYSLEEEI